MKRSSDHTRSLRAMGCAIVATLASSNVRADDDEAAALKIPSNYIEAGVIGVSSSSAKFGEYNGLDTSRLRADAGFGLRMGDAYTANETGGTTRWSLVGEDLGLTTRSLAATYANQGRYEVGISFDELRHNLSDTYRTPYQGAMGGNTFLMPAGFGTVANTTTLSPAQAAAFHDEAIDTTRKNASAYGSVVLSRQWSASFDYNHLDQTGAKPMAFGSAGIGAATGEAVSILPMPTHYKTDTATLALNWRGDSGSATASYFGSFFHDDFSSVRFQTYAGASTVQTMPTAPSNTVHQLNLAGLYALTTSTKVIGSLSYGRNTQNASFIVDPGSLNAPMPASSLNGRVVTEHADFRLVNQTTRDLTLSAAFKFDERDNRTPSKIYDFFAISGGNEAIYPNTPLSTRKNFYEGAADYRIDRTQNLHVALSRTMTARWCNQYAVGAGYPPDTQCVVAPSSHEDKLDTLYRVKLDSAIDLRLGYIYSDRSTTSDSNAIAAFIGRQAGLAGENAGDFLGFYPYFDASRTEHAAKANLNWQISDRLGVQVGGRTFIDRYGDTTYGVQKGKGWSLDLDSTYVLNDTGSLSAYVTNQRRQRDLTDLQTGATPTVANATRISVPAFATWTNKLKDDSVTVGVGARQGGLWGGRVLLGGDLMFTQGRTGYNTQLNYTGLTTGGLTCADVSILSCGALPDIKSTLKQVKLSAAYQIDKKSSVLLRFIYQRLDSNDFYYNGYQTGLTPTSLLPTNQQSPNYHVNVIAASYAYRF